MKWLVIALLLANVAYFTWEFNRRIHESPAASAAPSLPSGIASLELLQELDELPPERAPPASLQAADAATASEFETEADMPSASADTAALDVSPTASVEAQTAPPSEAALCLEFGPVSGREKVRDLQRWLSERALWTRQRSGAAERHRYFWVYLEPVGSDGDAQSRLADLANKGVSDVMLIKKGGFKNAISLGVFSSQDSVNRRLAELTGQGYQPLVVPRVEIEKKFWISAGLSEQVDIDDLLIEIPVPANGRQRDCSKIALGTAGE